MEPSGSIAVDVAKDVRGDGTITLGTGCNVRLRPVGGGIVTRAAMQVPDPEIPMWHNPDKDTDEPNPSDPRYVAAVASTNAKRSMAIMEAIMMMGVELVDGVPADNVWAKKLHMLGIQFDDADDLEREFAYKRYIAVGVEDYQLLGTMAGVSEEAVRKAQDGFRS